MRLQRLLGVALIAVSFHYGACPCLLLAQQPSTSPTFVSSSELVLIPVLARKDGKDVADLVRGEFVILDNGKARPVATFEAPPAAPRRPTVSLRGHSEFTNIGQEAPRSLTIIALDPLNTNFGDMQFAKDAVLRFLNSAMEANTRVAVIYMAGDGYKVIHDFSQDPSILRKAVEKARLESALPAIDSQTITPVNLCESCVAGAEAAIFKAISGTFDPTIDSNRTADVMRAVAQNFGSLPGRKSLVWVTDGFRKIQPRPVLAGAASADSGAGTPTAIWDSAFRALNDANISVYPVHATGLKAFVHVGGAEEIIHDQRVDTLLWVADETGGQAFYNSNDILHSIQLASSDSDSAYMLAFRLPADAKKGWHQLQVKVNRPGVHIVARKGYFAGQRSAAMEEELSAAMKSPFPYTELPLAVKWSAAAPATGGKKVVPYHLSVPAGALQVDAADRNHVNFELRTQARTAEMKTESDLKRDFNANLSPESLAKFSSSGFTYDAQLELPPGEYDVRFVVRDKLNNRIGALTAPLTVQ